MAESQEKDEDDIPTVETILKIKDPEVLRETAINLGNRCRTLERIVSDTSRRLEKQEDERIRVELDAKLQQELGQKRFNEVERQLAEMTAHALAQGRQLEVEREKTRRIQRDLHLFHKRKHDMAEWIRREQDLAAPGRDRERAVSDIRLSAGRGSGRAISSSWNARSRAAVRARTSGNIFSWAFAACGPGRQKTVGREGD